MNGQDQILKRLEAEANVPSVKGRFWKTAVRCARAWVINLKMLLRINVRSFSSKR